MLKHKYIYLIISHIFTMCVYSQNDTTSNQKIYFDIQLFGASPIYSLGINKEIRITKKSNMNFRLGLGVYPEFKYNKYAYENNKNFYEKLELVPSLSIPFEISYNPYKKIYLNVGISYNTFTQNYARRFLDSFFNVFYYDNRITTHRLFFSSGVDYSVSKKIRLGIRLISFMYVVDGAFVDPYVLPIPNIQYKF